MDIEYADSDKVMEVAEAMIEKWRTALDLLANR